ncbi:MAG: putative major facilitator superfamily transporter, partial [Ilumatobacteraceae bacterium]|nr:putative major facilitator superfamily transporter [Ilumatobacteraceae bacterium]
MSSASSSEQNDVDTVDHGFTPGSARAALAYPDFRRMWIGSLSSNIGTWMQNVVLPAYVYERTGKASVVGLLVFAQLGPLLLLSIPAGVIADRFDRRRWLIAMQLVQMVFSIALAPLVAADAPLWSLFVVALGVGVGNALNAPAWSAMLPTLVSKADLPGSISLNSTAINGSRVIGPIIVASLSPFGVTSAQFFLINAATYLFVVVALVTVHIPPPAHVQHQPGWRQFTAGLRLVRDKPVASRLLISLATFSFLSLPYVGLFPAVAKLNFGIDEKSAGYKWLYATWGLGACLGGLAVGTIFVGWDKRRLIRSGFAAFAACLTVFALAREPIGGFISGFVLGFAYFTTTTSMLTIMQSRLADHERGRVMSLWFMAFGGTVPLGNLVFGPVIDAVGARVVLVGGAVWALLLAWWCNIEAIDLREHVHPAPPDHTALLDEHGISAGD